MAEGKIEPRQRLDRRQARHLQRRLDTAAFTDGEFLGEQRLDGLNRRGLAALKLLDNMIERLQGPWHAQADQVIADPLDRRSGRQRVSHGAASFVARRLPTAS
jgi:hypothetical protein